MKCLTIRQPWATLISLGEKQFETRSWQTAHRGDLAIHSGTGALTPQGIFLYLRSAALLHCVMTS